MCQPKNLLDCLPTELLGLIKDSLEDHDLVGHANFSQLTLRTASLYDDDFWRQLCRMNGLGALTNEESGSHLVDWYKAACECALHALRCTHPGCGRARLAENVREITRCMNAYPDFPPLITTLSPADDMFAEPSRVFKHFAFKRVGNEISSQCIPYLRPEGNESPHQTITDHPIAHRTFAAFPPVNAMSLFDLTDWSIPTIENDTGVTVSHVMQIMSTLLEENLSVSDAIMLIAHVNEEVFPPSWSTVERLQSLETIMDWFRIVRWDGFDCENSNANNRYYSWNFAAVPETLPETRGELSRVDDIVHFELNITPAQALAIGLAFQETE